MTTVVVTSNYYISNYIFKNASRMFRMLRIEVKQCEDVEVLCLCPEDIKRFCNFEQTWQRRCGFGVWQGLRVMMRRVTLMTWEARGEMHNMLKASKSIQKQSSESSVHLTPW